MTRRDRTATPCTSARPGPRRRRRRKSRSRSAAGPSRPRSEGDGGFRAESSDGFPRPPSGRSRRPAAPILHPRTERDSVSSTESKSTAASATGSGAAARTSRSNASRTSLPEIRSFDGATGFAFMPGPYQAPEGKSIFRRVRWRIGSNVTPRFVAEGRRMRRPYRKWRVPLILVLPSACGASILSKGRRVENLYPFRREYVSLLLSFLPDERVRLPFLTT